MSGFSTFLCFLFSVVVVLLLSAVVGVDSSDLPDKSLYCAVCELLVDEMEAGIERTTNQFTVQTKWRIDEKKRIPYARTEHRLLEILEEEIHPLLRFYGSSNQTGRIRLIRKEEAAKKTEINNQTNDHQQSLDSSSSTSSSDSLQSPPSDFSYSASITQSIIALYDKLLDSWLEEIILLFHREEAEIKTKLCIKTVRACKKGTNFHTTTTTQRTDNRDSTNSESDGSGGSNSNSGSSSSSSSSSSPRDPSPSNPPPPDSPQSHHSDL